MRVTLPAALYTRGVPLNRLLLSDDLLVTSDLPAQAYARHLAMRLPDAPGTALIGAMRQLLEHGVAPAGVDPAGSTAWQAVDLIGRTTGLDDRARTAAAAAARDDVDRSLFLLDPADRLTALLDHLEPAEVVVVTDNPADTTALIAAVGLSDRVHRIVDGPPDGSDLALAACWSGLLEQVAAAGGRTGLVDRFGPGPGRPTWRAATADLLFATLEADL